MSQVVEALEKHDCLNITADRLRVREPEVSSELKYYQLVRLIRNNTSTYNSVLDDLHKVYWVLEPTRSTFATMLTQYDYTNYAPRS